MKLSIDPANVVKLRRMPVLKTWRTARPVSQKLVTTYYDTPDLALRHAGIELRVCRAGRRWIQTIKRSETAQSHQRTEYESQLPRCTPDLGKITDHALLKLFSHLALDDQLQPVFISRLRRISWLLSFTEGDEIKLSLERGEIIAGQSVLPVCEVELLLKAGRAEKLYEVARELLEIVQLMPESSSQVERGFALYSGAPASPVKAESSGLT